MPGLTHPISMTDAGLVESARQGDRQAFRMLVDRHWQAAAGVVYRMVGDRNAAQDAAQEAFLRAWQQLDGYKPEHSFRSWICTIAVRAAIDRLRRERDTESIEPYHLQAANGRPECDLEARERADQVRKAVLALPPASRAVLVLREYEGFSYQEIAEALQIPIGTVMSRLNYARTKLRLILAPYMEA